MSFLVKLITYTIAHHSKICVIGAGTAGVNVSAHLLRSKVDPRDITIFQPAHFHYYQPGWTMVGGGLVDVHTTRQTMQKIIPDTIHQVRERVQKITPNQNLIVTDKNHHYTYDHLIVASGFKIDWDKIKGAKQLLDDHLSKVCSIYDYDYAEKTKSLADRFVGGKAIFTEPKLPIKCAGAPQKILYLLTKKWKKKLLTTIPPEFIKAEPVMFMVPKYSDALYNLAKSEKIKVTFDHNLIQVTKDKAIFEHVLSKERLEKQYDFLHLVPPMSPPAFIKESGIGNQAGFVDVNDFTLRHNKYSNIWALGDSSSLPCSKTAAAIYSQTPVLVKNLMAAMKDCEQQDLPKKYNGYSSCPLFVGGNKLVLAEFLYDKKVDETFFSDQEKPRRLFYYMTKYWFPFAYWKLMPRGLWKGREGIRWRD